MNDFEIDQLIESGLSGNTASDVFRERLLRESTEALMRSRALRKRLRMTGLTIGIALITIGAFICGQRSVYNQLARVPMAPLRTGEKENTVGVPRELVAWLEVGALFRRLGLNERADHAYKRASELIPDNISQIRQARLYRQKPCHSVLEGMQMRVCSKGFMEQTKGPGTEDVPRQTLEQRNEVPSKIMAWNLGD
ncbi:MAG: hypothetical protein HWN69_08940 [Desulfobacterales bacterium]|nr:hypothetical protein [Desulfobacterales bacterium]